MPMRYPLMALVALAGLSTSNPSPPVPPAEHVEVRLAQFDVVVRDSSGRVVSGLSKDDFTVLEDGIPMDVVAADEWGVNVAPAPRLSVPARDDIKASPEAMKAAPAGAEAERRSIVLV